ncbi:MAG TPA: hypothetical protein VJS45_12670 [Acidimicrobiia bacterium]|nr:hypothetical protein [Acidimicrobiia bacterium]
MDLKRWLMALALAALLTAPIGASTTALADSGETAYGAVQYHDQEGEGDGEGEEEGEGEGEGEGEESGGSVAGILKALEEVIEGVAAIIGKD